MTKYITKMKFSALFLLACRAVVREREALAGLEATVEKYGFSTLVFPVLTHFIAYSLPMPLLLGLNA